MKLATMRNDLLEGVIQGLDHIAPKQPEAEHLATGRTGELTAFFYLRRQGYKVVARDWKSPRAPGDIDLIAWEGDTLCFVEVKTRTNQEVATAEAAVDEHKRRTLRRLAGHYARNLPQDTPTRFDVLTIYVGAQAESAAKNAAEVELFRGAFDWSESQFLR